MEAIGSYWIGLASYLHAQGFTVAVVNPAQAHDFAQALLRRNKTDALDAQMLAQLAQMLKPAPWQLPPQVYQELNQRLGQRQALQNIRQQLRNQLHALLASTKAMDAVVVRQEQLITAFDQQIKELEKEIERVADSDVDWAKTIHLLVSVPGIGLLSASIIASLTLCFASCPTAQTACSYAGLVPQEHQSGTSVHGRARIGHSGNGQLRRTFYLCALPAIRFNPVMHTFYERLRSEGNPAKVALCAVARKLCVLCWWIVHRQQPFDLAYAQGKVELVS